MKKIQFNPGPLTISQYSPKNVIIIYETNEDKNGKGRSPLVSIETLLLILPIVPISRFQFAHCS